MSLKNGHRAKAQIKRKKKVLQRIRTRELRKSLTANTATAAVTQTDSKTESTQ